MVQRLNTSHSAQLQKQTLQRQEMPEDKEELQMKPEFTIQRETNLGEESVSYDPNVEGDKEVAMQKFHEHNEWVGDELRQKGSI